MKKEFDDNPPPLSDWILARGAAPGRSDSSPIGHGTCVASKALGSIGGVSKSSRLVIVKISLKTRSITDAFLQIQDDIRLKRRQRKAVVVVAWGSRQKLTEEEILAGPLPPWQDLGRRFQDILGLNVPIVVSAGNDGRKTRIVRSYPAAFKFSGFLETLIVAGALDKNGNVADFSQTTGLNDDLWAPGVGVTCAKKGGRYRIASGTSYSSPMVCSSFALWSSCSLLRFKLLLLRCTHICYRSLV